MPQIEQNMCFAVWVMLHTRAMGTQGYALFETRIGRCGIAWNERGVACLQLPERDAAATHTRLLKRLDASSEHDTKPTPVIEQAITAIRELLQGEPHDLQSIQLDMDDVPEFARRVYRAARLITPGVTQTYGELARRIGAPGAARAVGRALGQNPFAIIVPCHRVLAAAGGIGGFSARGGVQTKWRLLEIERAVTSGEQLPLGL
jgi:methylated-DNA-[protein]-cysteine S-methyltransferase